MASSSWDTLLSNLCQTLKQKLGNRLLQVVLYGSQARNEAEKGSDIDLLLVLANEQDSLSRQEVTDITYPYSLAHDCHISCQWLPQSRYEQEDSPFLRNIRREGKPLT